MNQPAEPTKQTAPEFMALQPNELLDRLVLEEDRAPLELVEACAAQGEAMVDALRSAIDDERRWSNEDAGEWWLMLHAALILGRIPSESAGLLLVHLMRCMDEHHDPDFQDWLAGDWPALFANKPEGMMQAVRELVTDTSLDWYIRCQGVEVLLDAGLRAGDQSLDDAIDEVANFVRSEPDEWLFRISIACTLLGFPRERTRALLETMACEEQRRQAQDGYGFVGMFTVEDVDSAFARNVDEPDWRRRGDPWRFYDPDAIAARQQRWAEEDARAALDDPDWDVPTPYVRATSKVGRNDPCPCGSGKKYKRCCLAHDEAVTRNILEQARY